jgi:FixJ family two-component response regulator
MDGACGLAHGFLMTSQKYRGLKERPLVSVVDDDESVPESLPDLLKEFGFSAQAFSSGQAFLSSGSFDETRCLILDVAMPGMSGLFSRNCNAVDK